MARSGKMVRRARGERVEQQEREVTRDSRFLRRVMAMMGKLVEREQWDADLRCLDQGFGQVWIYSRKPLERIPVQIHVLPEGDQRSRLFLAV